VTRSRRPTGWSRSRNNREFAHSRTDFQDAPEPHRKRHLIRVWTRDEGRRTFHA
jgi:hypothetical protein